ncbi:hypothetical protein GCM10027586_09160 [Kineococcus gypseus]|uniref:hypothetical protein n=1 Tax=Kineococcus gypseus TaxID=1637102 RepID=UPI003D7D6200
MIDPPLIEALTASAGSSLLLVVGILASLMLLYLAATAACTVIAHLSYRRAHARAAMADPAAYRLPVTERVWLRQAVRVSDDKWRRITALDRKLLRRRTRASWMALGELDDICRRARAAHAGHLDADQLQHLQALEARERRAVQAERRRRRSRDGQRRASTPVAVKVPTLRIQKDLPQELTEDAAWIRRTFDELAVAHEDGRIQLDARQAAELEALHRAVDELWTTIVDLPADLREQADATGSTPLRDATCAQSRLAHKLRQVRREAWAGTTVRVDTLRRYGSALAPVSALDLGTPERSDQV